MNNPLTKILSLTSITITDQGTFLEVKTAQASSKKPKNAIIGTLKNFDGGLVFVFGIPNGDRFLEDRVYLTINHDGGLIDFQQLREKIAHEIIKKPALKQAVFGVQNQNAHNVDFK